MADGVGHTARDVLRLHAGMPAPTPASPAAIDPDARLDGWGGMIFLFVTSYPYAGTGRKARIVRARPRR